MDALSRWRWSALAVVLGLVSSAARADMISPDSIPNPPTAVGSTNGTSVNASNLVTGQYAGLGLDFPGGSAITRLNGVSVWASVSPAGGSSSAAHSSEMISYYGSWAGGSFVLPGSSTSPTVSSLSLEIIGNSTISLGVYGVNGQLLNLLPVLQSTPGPYGGKVWTFTGTGIASFSGFAAVVDPQGPGYPPPNPAWGVASISFTTAAATAPEPSSLVLAGLGALGLAARWRWRRVPAAA